MTGMTGRGGLTGRSGPAPEQPLRWAGPELVSRLLPVVAAAGAGDSPAGDRRVWAFWEQTDPRLGGRPMVVLGSGWTGTPRDRLLSALTALPTIGADAKIAQLPARAARDLVDQLTGFEVLPALAAEPRSAGHVDDGLADERWLHGTPDRWSPAKRDADWAALSRGVPSAPHGTRALLLQVDQEERSVVSLGLRRVDDGRAIALLLGLGRVVLAARRSDGQPWAEDLFAFEAPTDWVDIGFWEVPDVPPTAVDLPAPSSGTVSGRVRAADVLIPGDRSRPGPG